VTGDWGNSRRAENVHAIAENHSCMEEREIGQLQNKVGAPAREASEGSVKRIIEKVDADAGHAKATEGLNMRYAADEFALEWREGMNFLGNF
jgi:hypothetical protein